MKIELRLFAGIREAIGEERLELELPPQATIAMLRQQLDKTYPAVSPLLGHSSFAIDHSYADEHDVIPVGSSVACIPPVSGG